MIKKEDKEFIIKNNDNYSINEYFEIFNRIYPKLKLRKFFSNNKIPFRKLTDDERKEAFIERNKKQIIRTQINHDYFKEWSRNMAYILGLWFADGYIGTSSNGYQFSIKLHQQDRYLLESILDEMDSEHKIYDKKDRSCEFIIGSKTIYNDILSLGGKERKSLDLQFPHVPEKFLPDFIRGYFDGDGSIYRDRLAFKILGTKEFLSELGFILDEQNIKISNIKQHHKERGIGNNCYRLGIYRSLEARKFGNYIYRNKESSLYMKRKYKRYFSQL